MEHVFLDGKPGCNNCILILTGTSTQAKDVDYLVRYLKEKDDCAVAVIDRFIGGPLHVRYLPKEERKKDLVKMITELVDARGIKKIHVIAHSYASFEIVNLLRENPIKYRQYIDEVILANPAGFSGKKRLFRHCLRFVFLFVLKEYVWLLKKILQKDHEKSEKGFITRKLRNNTSIFLKSLANLTRTLREVDEIVSIRIGSELTKLSHLHDYKFIFVVNSNDSLVLPQQTLEYVKSMVPPTHVLTFPGNHLDPLINDSIIDVMIGCLKKA